MVRKWMGMILLVSLALMLASCSSRNITTDGVQRIDPSDAKALLDEDEAVLYDVRSERFYDAKHAAGAISLPEAQIDARLSELPDYKTLIFY